MKKGNRISFIIYTLLICFVSSGVLAQECFECNDTYLPYSLSVLSRNVILIIQLLVPVIIIITGIVELVRAILAGDEKNMDEVKPKLIKKFIAGIMIFLVLAIVKFGIGILGSRFKGTMQCVDYFINKDAKGYTFTCPTREELENGTYVPGSKDVNEQTVFDYCEEDCSSKYGTGNQQYGECVQSCQEETTVEEVQQTSKDKTALYNSCSDSCASKYGTGNQQFGQCVTECQNE